MEKDIAEFLRRQESLRLHIQQAEDQLENTLSAPKRREIREDLRLLRMDLRLLRF